MTTFNATKGMLPWVGWFNGDLYWAVMFTSGPLRVYRSVGGVEEPTEVFANADAFTNGYPRLVASGGTLYAAYRVDTPAEAIALSRTEDGTTWTTEVLLRTGGNNPVALDGTCVAQMTLPAPPPLAVQRRDLAGGPWTYLGLCPGTGIAYLTADSFVSIDDNRASVPGMLNPVRCPGLTVGEQNGTGPKCVLDDGRGGTLWADDGEWINATCAVSDDGRYAVTAWQNTSSARVSVLTAAEIAALPSPVPPVPPDPSGVCFPSLPTYEKPIFCSAFFQYSLRPSSGITDDPFGNCATLVGSPTDPDMLPAEVALTPGALVVVGDQPHSDADLNRTVAWWVSGADIDSLAASVAACDPQKPIVAYLDRRGWPTAKPSWVTPSVWPSVQVYRAPGESLASFEAAVRADLDRVAAYGGYCWVTLRLDDYNGAGSVAQTLEACPIYDTLVRDYPCIVGLHLFADERKGGMAFHPDLRAWGKAFAGACGPRPSRYDYCTLPGFSEVYTLTQKLLQNRATYQLSKADRELLLALLADEPPAPPPDDLPDPPNGFWAVEAEWAAQPPDATHDGNLAFCRRVAQRLVASGDPRWGLNWKRGVMGDPSVDIVAYRWGPDDTDARIVDIIYAAEDPTQHGPTWSVHSIEEAGAVLWYPA